MGRFVKSGKIQSVVKNHVYNGGFEQSATAGWSNLGTVPSILLRNSARSMSWTTGFASGKGGCVTTTRAATTPGVWWYGLADVGVAVGGASRVVWVALQWYDAAGTLLSETRSSKAVASQVPGRVTDTIVVSPAAAPASTASVALAVYLDATDGTVGYGHTLLIDSAILAQGTIAAPFFNGATPSTLTYQYAWTGTPYSSPSTRSTYNFTAAETSTPWLVEGHDLREPSRAVVLEPPGASLPIVIYPPGADLREGRLTVLYDDPAQVQTLRALRVAGTLAYQDDDGTVTPIHARSLDVVRLPSARLHSRVTVDYVEVG